MVPEAERWDPVPGSEGRKAPVAPSADEDEEGRSDNERLVDEGMAGGARSIASSRPGGGHLRPDPSSVSHIASREVRLASRPGGIPSAANFTLARVELEPLPDRQVLVRIFLCRRTPTCAGA